MIGNERLEFIYLNQNKIRYLVKSGIEEKVF